MLIRYSGRELFDDAFRALRGHGNKEGGDTRNLQRVNPTLSVTFENCTFVVRNNTLWATDANVYIKKGLTFCVRQGNSNLNLNSSWPGIITVEGDLVREVVVRGCLFQDNSYPFDEVSDRRSPFCAIGAF